MPKNLIKQIRKTVITMFTFAILVSPVTAKTYDEIQNEIDQKQNELSGLEGELNKIQSKLNTLRAEHNGTNSKVQEIENRIQEIDLNVQANNARIEHLKQQIELKDLELQQKEVQAEDKITNLYMSSKRSKVDMLLESDQSMTFINDYKYQESLIDSDIDAINNIKSELEKLKDEKERAEKEIAAYNEENKTLLSEKTELEGKLSVLGSQINYTNTQQQGLRTQINGVKSQIGDLMAEQKQVLDYEYQQMSQNAQVVGGPINSGDIYFSGQGRDMYQGHGLGMSQFGAYGAAQSGMSAAAIVQFYYSGTTVNAQGYGSVTVTGYGTYDIEDYVSGLGEVPDKACGTQSQVNSNPSKYAVDSASTIWDCWPEESIKAQVIAARSYALTKGAALAPDATDQVFKGGNGKRWAANETAHQVAVYPGIGIIRAYYSSDNSQGHGTANHETIWSDYAGAKNPLPYLRAKDDSSFAMKTQWTTWAWVSGGFSYAKLNEVMQYEAANYPYGRSFIQGVMNDVGTIDHVEFVRDPSQRVWKIVFVGTNGKRREMAGWFFKSIWNDAAAKGKASGYIYSLTFSLLQKP